MRASLLAQWMGSWHCQTTTIERSLVGKRIAPGWHGMSWASHTPQVDKIQNVYGVHPTNDHVTGKHSEQTLFFVIRSIPNLHETASRRRNPAAMGSSNFWRVWGPPSSNPCVGACRNSFCRLGKSPTVSEGIAFAGKTQETQNVVCICIILWSFITARMDKQTSQHAAIQYTIHQGS